MMVMLYDGAMAEAKPVILILGPTAGGKTSLAIALANSLPGGGECICADSMQVYRGMDIGTAKPTPDEQAQASHHLFDIANPADDGFSVDTWLSLAEQTIVEIRGRDRYPIIVGGTNLYVQAFLYGLFEGPEPDDTLRDQLKDLEEADLREWLERVDPVGAERIHPNDRKRTIRAIEVCELTGTPLSELQVQWADSKPREDVIILGLDYPAEAINRRINARVKMMIEAGLVNEVRQLHEAGAFGRQASEALGYKQLLEALDGSISEEDAIEQIKIRTRRFAKQQRTWLRKFRVNSRSAWIEADELPAQDIVDKAITAIFEFADRSLPEAEKAP